LARKLELNDLVKFISVSDPQLSPDASKVAFVAVKPDPQNDDYKATIWVVNTADGTPVMYLSDGVNLRPRWSPDGRQILFLSRRAMAKEERGGELWISTITGGEPRLVLKLKGGIDMPQWTPDGRGIIFLSAVGEEEGEVKVVRRIPLWFNGVGFTYHLRKHLHLVDVNSGNVTQLTEGDVDVVYASVSHRGDRVAYVASTLELNPYITDLFVLDLKTQEQTKLTRGNMAIGPVCWSPDDQYIAFRGHDMRRGFSTHDTIWVIPSGGGEPKDLTRQMDRGCSRRVYYDLRGPYVPLFTPAPIWHEKFIYFGVSDRGRYNLYRVSPEAGRVEPVITGDFVIDDFSVAGDAIAYTKTTPTQPAEVWVRDGRGERQITNFNTALISELKLSPMERFEYRASDGATVEGWIMRPPEPASAGKLPAILEIHGGPKSVFGYSFMFEHQFFAAQGFVVVFLNPRGSDGYSEEFADIRGAYGRRDFQDIMEGLDYVTSTYEFVDPERVGVTGISYGGFMTNWIVTQTDRFKAAISQNGICSWLAEFGTTDIGFYFVPDQIGRDPWRDEQAYREMSPLTHAPNVKTPIMFIHSLEDYRCWVDQAITFFTALKFLGKEAELVLFMKGDHVFGWVGKPSLRMKRLEHMLRWFKKHLAASP